MLYCSASARSFGSLQVVVLWFSRCSPQPHPQHVFNDMRQYGFGVLMSPYSFRIYKLESGYTGLAWREPRVYNNPANYKKTNHSGGLNKQRQYYKNFGEHYNFPCAVSALPNYLPFVAAPTVLFWVNSL